MRSILNVARGSSLFAVTLLASGALVSTALAAEGDPCTADAECGEGYACEVEADVALPSADPGSGSGEDPGTDAETTGTCVIARRPCTADTDCDENYECEFNDPPSIGVCDTEGNCTERPSEESTTGECVGVPLDCSTDAECPEASACMSGLCTFAFTPCATDTECEDRNLCLPIESEVCTVSSCPAGDEDCQPVTVCEPVDEGEGYCFPAPQPCTSDAGCSGDWTCYDVPNDNELPGAWVGVDKSCLPPGIVGAIEGWVAVEGDEYDDSDTAGPNYGGSDVSGRAGMGPVAEDENEDGDAAPRGDGGASGEADGADETDDETDIHATASAAAETDDSGCRAAGAGASGTSALALLLAAAGLTVGRRRAARRG